MHTSLLDSQATRGSPVAGSTNIAKLLTSDPTSIRHRSAPPAAVRPIGHTVESGSLLAARFASSARRCAAGDDSASARGISRCHNCSMRGTPRDSRFRDNTKESVSSSVSWPFRARKSATKETMSPALRFRTYDRLQAIATASLSLFDRSM